MLHRTFLYANLFWQTHDTKQVDGVESNATKSVTAENLAADRSLGIGGFGLGLLELFMKVALSSTNYRRMFLRWIE